jgi:hypothetical protein
VSAAARRWPRSVSGNRLKSDRRTRTATAALWRMYAVLAGMPAPSRYAPEWHGPYTRYRPAAELV